MQRALIILALGLTLGLPFYLRPPQVSAPREAQTLVVITPHNEAIRAEYSRGSVTGILRAPASMWRSIGG